MVAKLALGVVAIAFAGLLGAGCEDLVFKLVDAPCYGSDRDRCRSAQNELQPIGQASCEGEGRRVCLAPLGLVSTSMITNLVDQYQQQYGLAVTILTPNRIPDLADSRNGQVDAIALLEHLAALFPDAYADPNAVLIGITPVDIYDQRSDFRFVFGIKGTPTDPKGVMSTFRMNPETFGDDRDDELLLTRHESSSPGTSASCTTHCRRALIRQVPRTTISLVSTISTV